MAQEITFTTDVVTTDKPERYSSSFRVTADVEASEVVPQFGAEEILLHIDRDEFLELIGEDYVIAHFGITVVVDPF